MQAQSRGGGAPTPGARLVPRAAAGEGGGCRGSPGKRGRAREGGYVTPNSVHERALSSSELFLRLEETAIIQELLISQNTIRKNQTSSSLASRYDKEWESKDDRLPEKRQTTISPFPLTPRHGFSGGSEGRGQAVYHCAPYRCGGAPGLWSAWFLAMLSGNAGNDRPTSMAHHPW